MSTTAPVGSRPGSVATTFSTRAARTSPSSAAIADVASTRDVPGNPTLPVLKLIAKLQVWNLLPNGRSATFFNLWTGHRRKDEFRAQLRADLARVFELVRDGLIEPQIAARFPLEDAADALRFAEAGGFNGKVVLIPGS